MALPRRAFCTEVGFGGLSWTTHISQAEGGVPAVLRARDAMGIVGAAL